MSSDLPDIQVQWNGDEPFISIPGHDGFHITPYRLIEADVAVCTEMSNMIEVGRWSEQRPYPYKEADAWWWFGEMLPLQQKAAAQLRAHPDQRVDASPFGVIRNEKGEYVGDCALMKTDQPETYGLGYALHPKYFGRRLGTAAIAALLGWARHGMAVKHVEASIQPINEPSMNVVKKLGFTRGETIVKKWNPLAGGGERELSIWRREI